MRGLVLACVGCTQPPVRAGRRARSTRQRAPPVTRADRSRARRRGTSSPRSHPDRIVAALETGTMRVQGETLTPEQRRAIAAYLSTARRRRRERGRDAGVRTTLRSGGSARARPPSDWRAWGVTPANDRFQRQPGFSVGAGAAPETEMGVRLRRRERRSRQPDDRRRSRVRRQRIGPRVRARLEGRLRALDVQGRRRRSGGDHVGRRPDRLDRGLLRRLRADVYSVDATTGELRWKKQIDEHRAARVTGSPVLYNGRLYVPVSSVEEAIGAQAGLRMLHVSRQRRRARSGDRRQICGAPT